MRRNINIIVAIVGVCLAITGCNSVENKDVVISPGVEAVDELINVEQSVSEELTNATDVEVAVTPEVVEASEPATKITEGIYLAGEDIDAGEYLLIREGDYNLLFNINSTWNYDWDPDNEMIDDYFASLLEVGSTNNRYYISLNEGEYLRISGEGYAIPINEVQSFILNDNGIYTDGMYKVGFDIPAGIYTIEPGEFGEGYYRITEGPVQNGTVIVDECIIKSSQNVELKVGQYLELNQTVINTSK